MKLTCERILADLHNGKKKKAIIDMDIGIEMDDQFALAYALGSDKIDLLSANAATFGKGDIGDYAAGTARCYSELERILKVCGRTDLPHYHGPENPVSYMPDHGPVDCEASRNIVETARKFKDTDEILYVLSTGCCTNIPSAFMMDPSIAENCCVIWLGGNCFDYGTPCECNLNFDYAAGQRLTNLDIPLILLPAMGDTGTVQLEVTREDINGYLPGDSGPSVFYRETLPDEFPMQGGGEWRRAIFDFAAPALLSVPDAFDLEIIPAPIFTDDRQYAFDRTRRKILFMTGIRKKPILAHAFSSIASL